MADYPKSPIDPEASADYTAPPDDVPISTLSVTSVIPYHLSPDHYDISPISDGLTGGGAALVKYYKMGGWVAGSYTTWVSTPTPTPIGGATDYHIIHEWYA